MTRNLYVGASLDPILGAGAPEDLPARVDEVWEAVAASDPPARMAAIADEIADAAPDLVALQEAAAWRTPGRSFDLLTLLCDALAARGQRYRVAVAGVTFAGALPGARAGPVELEDRGAILVRDEVEVRAERWSRFATLARVPVAGVEVEVPRGFASVVARVGGRALQLVGAHLEIGHLPPLAAVQLAQALEVAALVGATKLPVVVAGDLNARTDAAAYQALLACGLADAWADANPADPGLTCCQDRGLRNERSGLFERIDHLLVRGLAVRGAWRTGADEPAARGRWASDHAGVAADLAP
jgi:endonuclease/exonuclease/phosphatase family metal-dependent hydrolase